jgi:hypothetical protein
MWPRAAPGAAGAVPAQRMGRAICREGQELGWSCERCRLAGWSALCEARRVERYRRVDEPSAGGWCEVRAGL